jgi:polar amino acid transport system substrate-binding protein
LVAKLTTGRKVEGYEIQLYNRDHDVRDFLITYLPIAFDKEEGILGWVLDITDRKNAEKEIKEKFDELSRFENMAIGRELKMIGLKKEINELLQEKEDNAKYKIVTLDTQIEDKGAEI